MKYITLSLLCAGLVALASCKKENTIQPAQPVSQNVSPATSSANKEKPKPPRMFHAQYNKKTGNCWGRYGNCVVIETIVITGYERAIIDDAADSGSSTVVGALFNKEKFRLLPEYCLSDDDSGEKLQSGKYFITKTSDDGHQACYISGPEFPVTAEDMEFAFQLSYGEPEN